MHYVNHIKASGLFRLRPVFTAVHFSHERNRQLNCTLHCFAQEIRRLYDEAEGRAAILALPGHEALYAPRRDVLLGRSDTTEAVASGLFAALRALDDEGDTVVFAEAVQAEGLGLAVMNRLGRAAAFRIVRVD